MELSPEKRNAFYVLKVVCDGIVKNPLKEHPEQLKSVLALISSEIVSEFFEYIIFPIKLHLLNKKLRKSDDIQCILLQCLFSLLQYSDINSDAQFTDIYFIVSTSFLDEDGKPRSTATASYEEVKIEALKCAKMLLSRTDLRVLESLFKATTFYSKLSVLIYNSLKIAAKEKNTKLRVVALECLLLVFQLEDDCCKNEEFLNDVSVIVRKCLPGLLSETRNILSEGYTQNHQITKLALKLWGRSVALVMQDRAVKKELTVLKLDAPVPPVNDDSVLKSDELSEEWIKSAAQKLSPLSENFTKMKLHPHWKVRIEVAAAARLILTKAPINMSPSLTSLLDALIVLSEDEVDGVAEFSQEGIKEFKTLWTHRTGRTVVEEVQHCFASLLNRLPRILHSKNDQDKESDLILLSGYIRLLGPEIFPEIINSKHLLDKLINCLIVAATVDISSVSLLEEISLRDIEDDPVSQTPWKQLKMCYSTKLKQSFMKVCSLMRECCSVNDLTYMLLDLFSSSALSKREIILLINEIIISNSALKEETNKDLVKAIINEYMDPDVWHSPISDDDNALNLTKMELQGNVVLVCLLIEGIGKLATTLGLEKFSPYLFKTLYPLLEYAGNPLWVISLSGLQSVKMLAQLYGGDVSNLVKENADYLSHYVNLKLRNAHKNPRVLSVLSVVMKNSNIDVLPSFMEIVNNVLIQSCDRFQSSNLNAYLHVFKTFVDSLLIWMPPSIKPVTPVKELNLCQRICEYQKLKNMSEDFSDDGNFDNEEYKDNEEVGRPDDVGTGDETKTIPEHIQLCKAIMLRASHFLPTKDLSRQILITQILKSGALIMYESENELLPIVHKVWSPLVGRFKVFNHPLTIKHSFQLLTILAQTSKDFIRKRTMKEVIPNLCEILSKYSEESKLKPTGHAYRYSQKYKLQVCLLEGLGDLCINIDLQGKEIYLILSSVTPYLSALQPQQLQDLCLDLHKKLSLLNSDMVWLHVASLHPNGLSLNKEIDFQRSYKVGGDISKKPFCKNIDYLLDYLK